MKGGEGGHTNFMATGVLEGSLVPRKGMRRRR